MSVLLIDCETFSELDVTKVGSFVYANHPSTRVLLWSVRDPDWPRSLVYEEPNIWKLLKQLKDSNQIHWTRNEPLDLIHWSPFDRHIVQYSQQFQDIDDDGWDGDVEPGAYKGPNNTYWSDMADLSLIYGGPAKLAHAAKFFGEGEIKDTGKHLISRFCAPQSSGHIITKEEDPIRWEQFRAYAGQDTNVMVPILNRFTNLAENGGEDITAHWPYLQAIGRMNERGAPIDVLSAKQAEIGMFRAAHRATVECESEYGFKPTSIIYIKNELGLPDCQKETLAAFLLTSPEPRTKRLAEIRLCSVLRSTISSSRTWSRGRWTTSWSRPGLTSEASLRHRMIPSSWLRTTRRSSCGSRLGLRTRGG
jgi:DNA polymerase